MAEIQRTPLPSGHQIANYRIDRVVGTGGFGITYQAIDIESGERLAIKEYVPLNIAVRASDGAAVVEADKSARGDFEDGLARFVREAETVVALDHPSIVPVKRFLRLNGTAYLVMPFQDGEQLSQILARERTLDTERLKAVIYPLIDGLHEVHRKGFIHRDIKPGNILIRPDGTPVLLDFGAAQPFVRENETDGMTFASTGFTAPEQYARGGEEGRWTDIYALGAVMYRAISGRAPPDARERRVDDRMLPAADAGLLRYNLGFLRAIDSALSLDPRARPQTVHSFLAMLEGREQPTVPPGSESVPGGRRLWPAVAVAVALLAAAAVWLLIPGEQDKKTPDASEATRDWTAGTAFRDCETCPLMVVIPAGLAAVGGGNGVIVDVARPFAIGVYEVTRAQFAEFVSETERDMTGGCLVGRRAGVWQRDAEAGWRRPGFQQSALDPVVCVNLADASEFADWLSRRTGNRYRLPSETEWEYAARGASLSDFVWGQDMVPNRAVCADCGSRWDNQGTAPIGSFEANGFGVHDVHGNVAEWTLDCWTDPRQVEPAGPAPVIGGDCEKRVIRGGHWASPSAELKLDARQGFMADKRYVGLGFRLVRELE